MMYCVSPLSALWVRSEKKKEKSPTSCAHQRRYMHHQLHFIAPFTSREQTNPLYHFCFLWSKKRCTIPYKVSSLLITYFFGLMVVLEAVLKPYEMIFCTWRVRRVCFYRWEQGKNSTDVKQNFSFQFKVSPLFLASHCRAVTKKMAEPHRCVGFGDFNQINCFWKVLARRGEISSEIVLIYRFNYFCSIALPVPPHLNNA